MEDNSVVVVTAFFDIGRGDWNKQKGHPDYLARTTDKYFEYFKNLAELENHLVIFTSLEHVDRIKSIRKEKPTDIIELDFFEKFQECRNQIKFIQQNDEFRKKVNADQLGNPEYWSENYVLLTNLKSYFITKAIKELDLTEKMIAWIDFGYCRDHKTLNGTKKLNFSLDSEKIHFFTIKKQFSLTEQNVYNAILNNIPYIIGGVIIASKDKWIEFSKLIIFVQQKLLDEQIVDDDQGVFLLCLLQNPELFQLNYLGENQWFDVFKKYAKSSKMSFKQKIKNFFSN